MSKTNDGKCVVMVGEPKKDPKGKKDSSSQTESGIFFEVLKSVSLDTDSRIQKNEIEKLEFNAITPFHQISKDDSGRCIVL